MKGQPMKRPRKVSAKPAPKLRGNRQPVALLLPPELVARVDAVAAQEERSRGKMVELLLRAALDTRAT
jgi:hypothetical protein